MVIVIRYALFEIIMSNNTFIKEDTGDKTFDFSDMKFGEKFALFMIGVGDIIPLVILIACIRISAKSDWNKLLAGYLRMPREEEDSVSCGSHFLLDLRKGDLNSELLESVAFLDEIRGLEELGYSFDLSQIDQKI